MPRWYLGTAVSDRLSPSLYALLFGRLSSGLTGCGGSSYHQILTLLYPVLVFLFLLCACIFTPRAAHLVYPIRVRFPNVTTGKSGWITIGYIPAMKHKKSATTAHKKAVRLLRDELLQRCLAVVLDELITASAHGVKMTLPGHGVVWAVPRIVLYVADQPEERHLLGMKLSGCYYPCSLCMEYKTHVAVESTGARRRGVLKTLNEQLEAAELADIGERPARIEQLARQASISAIVPVLGAVHGLGTGTLSLFRIFGFDRLHVRFLLLLLQHVSSRAVLHFSNTAPTLFLV